MNKTKMLITGGARSGKSRKAQELASGLSPEGKVLYIATAKVLDEEMEGVRRAGCAALAPLWGEKLVWNTRRGAFV